MLYRKIINELFKREIVFQPDEFIEFDVCRLNSKFKSRYDPLSNKLYLCSNLFSTYAEFKQELSFQFTLMFDQTLLLQKPTCEQRACTLVRAVNFSDACKDQECFKKEIDHQLNSFEECNQANKELVFGQAYQSCLSNMYPLLEK